MYSLSPRRKRMKENTIWIGRINNSSSKRRIERRRRSIDRRRRRRIGRGERDRSFEEVG